MAYFTQDVIEEISIVIAHVIDGATYEPGAKRALAQRAGITPQHLSRIANGHNVPTLATAHAIADALIASGSLPASAAYAWFDMVREHADLVRRRTQAQRLQFRDDAFAAVARLHDLSHAVNFARDPAATGRAMRDAVTQGEIFLRITPFLSDQLAIARACLVLHQVYSAVGLQVQALRVSVHASRALERVDDAERRREQDEFDWLVVNARRTEAVALYNLKLAQQAYHRSRELEHHAAFRKARWMWTAHIFRDRLNAISQLPRVSLSEAEGLILQVKRSLEHPRTESDEILLDVLIHESLAKVLISRGKFDRARHILTQAHVQLHGTQNVGALHETLLLRSLADAAWHLGERQEWRAHVDAALSIAGAAGLQHQIDKIYGRYGEAIAESE